MDTPFSNHEQMAQKIAVIANNSHQYATPETLRRIFGFIDLTSLNTEDTKAHIKGMVEKVNQFPQAYPEMPNVAAICVYPSMVETVKENLKAEAVQIASVGAGFPSSQTFLDVKIAECKAAVEAGADEVDIVISVGTFFSEAYEEIKQEIAAIKQAMGDKHLKVILESGSLATYDNIYKASMLAMEAGADFIKTSTGKQQPAATIEAAFMMCTAIKEFYEKTGKKIGFKPAGGISQPEDGLAYYAIVKEILGEEWLSPEYFRIGASRLANNLLSAIYNENIAHF
ncbi:MAG: deoxyribose-phosphate aldolase [Bacteroidota bacterium]